MTEIGEEQMRRQAVAAIVGRVGKKTALIVSAMAALSLAYVLFRNGGSRWWFIPASILFGGLLGLLNFRWLALSVERIYLRKGATPGFSNLAAILISILKLTVIFIILFIVIKWHFVHILGLVGGLSLCFLAILWEGVTLMRQTMHSGGQ